MAYKSEYLTKLKNIIDLINQDKLSGASAEFKIYIDNLDVEKYSIAEWNQKFREEVYRFGALFKTKDAGLFIDIINEALKTKDETKKEIIEFISSEIIWNYFLLETNYVSTILKDLIKKYPSNPEFHHSYSHFLESKGNYDLSIEESFLALKIEPTNDVFYQTSFNKCKHCFDYFLLKGKTEEAEKIIEKMEKIVENREDFAFNNIIVSLRDRIADHKIIDKRIEGISGIAQRAVERERGRLIEIMGFFVAILGFVFININLAVSLLKFNEILLIMLGMGLVLSFFATLISILFRTNKILYKEPRLWLLVVFIVLFIVFVCKYKI